MKKLFALLLAAAMVGSTAACGQAGGGPSSAPAGGAGDGAAQGEGQGEAAPAGGKVEIELLRQGAPEKANPIFEPIIEAFEKENPNITVKFSVLGWSEANTKLRLLANAGKLPDVTFINIINGYELANDGLLMDLYPLLDKNQELRDDMPESVTKAVEFKGGLYWMPCATGAYSLWYNKELFAQAGLDAEKPPATIEEMVEYAKIITEKTGVPGLGFGAKALEDLAHVTMSFYSSYTGVSIWDQEKRQLTVDEGDNRQKFIEALQVMQNIVQVDGVTQPNPVEFNPFALRPLLRDGQIAMDIDGAWVVKELAEDLDKGDGATKFGTALFPAGPAGSHPILGVDGWGIPADCKHTEEAWKLLSFLMRSDNQTAHATKWGLLPILKSEQGKPEYQDKYWQALMAQVDTVFGRPQDPQIAMIEQKIADAAQELLLGGITPEQAIDQMKEQIAAELN